MDSKPSETTSEQPSQETPQSDQQTTRSKLRDLRPEKDPMGAGRNRPPKTSPGQP
jgi:hypothetical protein